MVEVYSVEHDQSMRRSLHARRLADPRPRDQDRAERRVPRHRRRPHPPDRPGRGAHALEPSRTRLDPTGRVHRHRRADGHRSARSPTSSSSEACAAAGRLAAGRAWSSASPSTSRDASSPTAASSTGSRATCEANDLPAELLTLEVTETEVMADLLQASRVLDELAVLGIRIAIDDYGTGYSSLAYLHRLPVQELKIDRSFVTNLPNEHSNRDHRPVLHRDGALARPQRRGRGSRGRRDLRHAGRRGLRPDPGLLPLQADARRRPQGVAPQAAPRFEFTPHRRATRPGTSRLVLSSRGPPARRHPVVRLSRRVLGAARMARRPRPRRSAAKSTHANRTPSDCSSGPRKDRLSTTCQVVFRPAKPPFDSPRGGRRPSRGIRA